jgi:hypothetical protein
MRRQSELWLLIGLLPTFFVGMLPMLLFCFLGSAGLGIAGVLLICVGLADGLHANNDFNREVIVHGYARGSERAAHISALHAAFRFATATQLIGAGLLVAGIFGFFYFG